MTRSNRHILAINSYRSDIIGELMQLAAMLGLLKSAALKFVGRPTCSTLAPLAAESCGSGLQGDVFRIKVSHTDALSKQEVKSISASAGMRLR